MARAKSRSSGIEPWSSCSRHQAEIAPGMVTACGLVWGISSVRPAAFSASTVAALAARPEPFSAFTAPPLGA